MLAWQPLLGAWAGRCWSRVCADVRCFRRPGGQSVGWGVAFSAAVSPEIRAHVPCDSSIARHVYPGPRPKLECASYPPRGLVRSQLTGPHLQRSDSGSGTCVSSESLADAAGPRTALPEAVSPGVTALHPGSHAAGPEGCPWGEERTDGPLATREKSALLGRRAPSRQERASGGLRGRPAGDRLGLGCGGHCRGHSGEGERLAFVLLWRLER